MTSRMRCWLADGVRLVAIVLPFALVGTLVAASGSAAWWVTLSTGSYSAWPLTLVALIVLGAVVEVVNEVRSSRSRPLSDGVELTKRLHPHLWEMVEELAVSWDTPSPAQVYLGLDPTQLCVMARTAQWSRRRVMVLGIAPMCALTVAQWRAALVQYLMMEEWGPARERRLVRGQRRLAARLAPVASGSRWDRHIARLLLRAHTWLADPICQRRQREADVRSAEITSPSEARLALLSAPAVKPAWERFWVLHVHPATEILRRPIDLVGGFRGYMSAVGVPDLPPTAPEMMRTPHSVSVETRLAALDASAPMESTLPSHGDHEGSRAVDLLGEHAALVDLELAWFESSGLTPLDWDGIAHVSASRGARQRAAWLLEQVSTTDHPGSLSTVLDDLVSTGGATLQQHLAGPSASAEDDLEDRRYVGDLAGDVIAAALVEDAYCHYVTTWGGPPTLVTAEGVVVDPWTTAAAATQDSEIALELVRLCRHLGVSGDYRPLPLGGDLGRTIMDADPVVLCAACFYTNWRVRYVFVLDTGLVIMRPRLSDLLVGGAASYAGDPGTSMLLRWSRRSGAEVMSVATATYTDWSAIRSVAVTAQSRGKIMLELQEVDGTAVKVKGDARSRFDGSLTAPLERFLNDRFTLREPTTTPPAIRA